MPRNAWVEGHDRWYARATQAERDAFDASRTCSRSKVFTPKTLGSPEAWLAFLTLQGALPEALLDAAVPERHKIEGQVRVYEALQDADKARAGLARCTMGSCPVVSTDVARYALTYQNGVRTAAHLCPACAAWQTIDTAMTQVTATERVAA